MGRPTGSKNASTILKESLLTESSDIIMKEFPKIVKAVVKAAGDGDMRAAKMLFDRVIPARKAVEHIQADGNKGITIIVQGIAKVEEGKPVIEHQTDAIEASFTEVTTDEES